MRTALLIIDVQNDYFPNGKNELIGAIEASNQIKKILTFFRMNDLPVIHIRHISNRSGATFFLPETNGSLIHDNVRPMNNETTIIKHYPNSFKDTNLDKILKTLDIKQLIITGMMTHMCVDSTIRAAYDFGYICTVAYDGCATKNLVINNELITADLIQKSFMSALNGLFAEVKCTDDIISCLIRAK